MKKMNPVIHFEMPATDSARMSKFYETTFGWNCQQMGPEMGNYVAGTTETDEMNRPKTPGAINRGFFPKSDDNQHPSVVIAVDDIRQAISIIFN